MTESTDVASGPAGRRGRRRAKRPRNADPNASTRVDILKSAARAFRKLGYHGATVEQIAAALHMKKGNLYYYFKNKEEILFACHQYSLDQLTQLMDEVQRSGASADDKLRRLIVAFVHTILDELHGTALFLDLEALTPAHLKAVIVRRDRFERGVRDVLEEGMADGIFARGDAKLLAFALFGAVNWIPRWFSPQGSATSQEIADRFADYLISGLRGVSTLS
jgi:AcrR family transcriptional regulator